MNRILLPFLVRILKSLNNAPANRVAVLGRQLVFFHTTSTGGLQYGLPKYNQR